MAEPRQPEADPTKEPSPFAVGDDIDIMVKPGIMLRNMKILEMDFKRFRILTKSNKGNGEAWFGFAQAIRRPLTETQKLANATKAD